ncbi:MAG: rRNA biogenesis protein rrp5 [Anaerovoracaceae bacterium]|jgi:predicted HTH transcriptional regulator
MTQEELLKSIASDLRKTADDIEMLAGLKRGAEPEKKPGQAAEAVPEEKPVTLEELRTVLSDKSSKGFGSQVRDLIRSYGAVKLSAVDPAHYGEMLKKAEVIGNAG